MKLIRDKIIDFFKTEDLQQSINTIVKPISVYIYDETYIYLWCFCIYHIFQIFTIMLIIYLLLKILNQNKNIHNYYNDSYNSQSLK
jgi:hypothetical protein